MSNPVVELITQDIVEKIDAIKVADGWNQDLNAVRPTRLGNDENLPIDNGLVIVHQEDPDDTDLDADRGSQGLKAWAQPYLLECIVWQDDDATTPIDTLINRVRADIEKKLMEDESRGGNAIETLLGGSMKFTDEGDAELTGIIILITVQYRVRLTDPYTKSN